MLQNIHEWFNPFTGNINLTFVVTVYKVLLFVGFITIIYAIKKKDFLYALMYILFALYSMRAIRFTVDYELIIIFFIAVSFQFYLNKILENKASASRIIYGNVLKIIYIILLLFVSIQIQSGNIYLSLKYYRLTGLGLDEKYLPVQLFNFIKENNIKGTPFNNFESGGYLVWNTEGEKNFIDSRNLSDELFGEYNSIFPGFPGILRANVEMSPAWAVTFPRDPKKISIVKLKAS